MYNQQTNYLPYYGVPQYQRTVPQETQPIAPMSYQVAQNYIKGRPVVSIDEAKASQIDLDGSLYVFPDLGNKRIYTKQINMDGTASFNVFELSTRAEQPTTDYITREELNSILANFKETLNKPQDAAQPTARFNL